MSYMANTRITYNGTAPGADSNTYSIFSTVTAFNGTRGGFALCGIKRFEVDIKHSQAGTLKAYYSTDGGTTWIQYYDSGSIAAPASGSSTRKDFNVHLYTDWKLDWVNGGSAQATWVVAMGAHDNNSQSAV